MDKTQLDNIPLKLKSLYCEFAISKGGPDTIENVKPSHALCNIKKNAF